MQTVFDQNVSLNLQTSLFNSSKSGESIQSGIKSFGDYASVVNFIITFVLKLKAFKTDSFVSFVGRLL